MEIWNRILEEHRAGLSTRQIAAKLGVGKILVHHVITRRRNA